MYSQSVEDYLEAIYNIIAEKGYVRTKDIAEELNVTSPSVSAMLKKLQDEKLIFYEKYGGVTMTHEGEKIAKTIKHRHDTLKKLLNIILVPEDIANRDACKLEHNLNSKSIEQLTKFVQFIESRPIHSAWFEHFNTFCETGEYGCKKLIKKE